MSMCKAVEFLQFLILCWTATPDRCNLPLIWRAVRIVEFVLGGWRGPAGPAASTLGSRLPVHQPVGTTYQPNQGHG